MPKAKRPEQDSNRSGMDYYEYKRQHDLVRMRQRAVEVAGDVERPEDRAAAAEQEQRGASQLGRLFGGLKRAKEAPEATDDQETSAAEVSAPEASHASEQAPAQPQANPMEAVVQAVSEDTASENTVFSEDEAQGAATDSSQPDPQFDDGEAEDDLEITNPFAGALDKLKLFGGKLASGTAALKQRMAKPEREDDDDDDASDADGQAAPETKAVASLTMALSEDDDTPSRRWRASAVHMVSNEDEGAEDPLGVMRPADGQAHLAFMRPETQNQSGENQASDKALEDDRVSREGSPMNDNENTRPELTEKLMGDLNGVPALSRRERKAMASAGTLAKPAAKPAPALEDDDDDGDTPAHVDEPTQQFRPLRARPVKPAPTLEDDDADEDDDDDIAPQKSRFGGFGGKKRRVYRDEDLDDEDDGDYEDEDADYDYVDDEDEEEEYDDYDEEESFESAYHVSFGKRVLGFLKGILILAIVFLLVVVALRQLEANHVLSLDIVRETIGQLIPIDNLLPPPSAQTVQPIVVPQEEEATPEPTQEPEPTPEPTAPPEPEPTPSDPGVQGNPLGEEETDLEEDIPSLNASGQIIA